MTEMLKELKCGKRTNKQNFGLSGKNKSKKAVKKLGCAQAIMNHRQLFIKINPNK